MASFTRKNAVGLVLLTSLLGAGAAEARPCGDIIARGIQGGQVRGECVLRGSYWRGAEHTEERFTFDLLRSQPVESQYGTSLQFALAEEVGNSYFVVRIDLRDGGRRELRELPVHLGVDYGHGCTFDASIVDDNELALECTLLDP
jgi:hypothetical protein